MAQLDELMKKFKVDLPLDITEKAKGRKRRAWLEENSENILTKSSCSNEALDKREIESREDVKLSPNLVQTEAKVGTEPSPNLDQTEGKVCTELSPNLVQTRSMSDNKAQDKQKTGSKVGTEPSPEPSPNPVQTGSKVGTEINFFSIVGLQSKVVLFIYNLCKSDGSTVTRPISISYINEVFKTTSNASQQAIKRVIKKGFLKRNSFKTGRGGWTRYELPKIVYEHLFKLESQSKLSPNLVQSEYKPGTQEGTEPSPNLSSSSSSLIINKETTSTNINELSTGWISIQTPQVLKNLHFGKNIIVQVSNANLVSPEELQESLNAFAFDITENKLLETKKIQNPVAYFMGIMRRKQPYTPPSNYKSDENKAIEENIKRLEEAAAKLKSLQEMRKREEDIQLGITLEEWMQQLSIDDKKMIVPEKNMIKVGTERHNKILNEVLKSAIDENIDLHEFLSEIHAGKRQAQPKYTPTFTLDLH